MESEMEAQVTMKDGTIKPVTVCYEVDDNGYKPLLYGMFDENDNDVTNEVTDQSCDMVYEAACQHIFDTMSDAADMMEDR